MLEEIFYEIDNFCNSFEKITETKLLETSNKSHRKCSLTMSEILTIIVYFHFSGYKNFKEYYTKHVLIHMSGDFKTLVSYNRFIELKQRSILLLMIFSKLKSGQCTGKSIIDSTDLKVCHIRREHSHKLFKGDAKKGKTSVGWFYGFKLHVVISIEGEILDYSITPGNVADNNKKNVEKITKNIFGKLAGDKGYIGLFESLFSKGIKLIHKLRSNMENKLMELEDKFLLKKRSIIETFFGILKNDLLLEHTRHRSRVNYFVHIFSTLVAYSFR